MFFLLQYDRHAGRLESLQSFEDATEASRKKIGLEIDLMLRGLAHEVVVLEASNEESLRATHRRYFESLQQIGSSSSVIDHSKKDGGVRYWSITQTKEGWSVRVDNNQGVIYPTSEQAVGVAAMESKEWSRESGRLSGVRIKRLGGEWQEITV